MFQYLNAGGFVCQTLHRKLCPCASVSNEKKARVLNDDIPRYHEALLDLIDSGRYDTRDDFTIVIQPFMALTKIPYKKKNIIDFTYFAPDCFHFSGECDLLFHSDAFRFR